LEIGGDILVVPQASLGGKVKGKNLQYHALIDKEEGSKLYDYMIQLFVQKLQADDSKKAQVKSGSYGNRQGLKFETAGPYTHQFEF